MRSHETNPEPFPRGLAAGLMLVLMLATLGQGGAAPTAMRSLLIATTDLDLGWMRMWDATRIAKENKPERFKQVLLASAALPGVFAPIEIDGQLHADGGTSAQYAAGIDLEWVQDALESLKDNPDSKLRESQLSVDIEYRFSNRVITPVASSDFGHR